MNANRNGTSSVNGGGGDFRYSKEKFLEVFRAEKDAGSLLEGVDGLLIGGFQPSESNGVASATWGRREEPKDNHSVDLCWDRNARMYPLGLQEFTDEETDVCRQSLAFTCAAC
jgi:PERQ amino acid-rich with GYF domain-containing protein